MTNSLSHALAHAIVDDRLRTAQEDRTTRPTARRFRQLMSRR